ncbi:MAG: hypothetical protein NVSMB25_23390 [Thermoleophilaceae bacterium]
MSNLHLTSSTRSDLDTDTTRRTTLADALAYCRRPAHIRRTLRVALVVGLLLNGVNEATPIANGQLGALTWIRVALNFIVPFVVSNIGLLSGRRR